MRGPFPKTLTFTLADLDWEYVWGASGAKFDLETMLENRHWENVFGGLEVLTMELEANEEEKAALAPLVKRLREYVFDIGNGEVLFAEEDLKESKWTGPLDSGRNMEPKWENGTFFVVAIFWKVRKAPE